ncbi:130_t:CDS:1, partial [Racocetra persica]
SEIIDFLWSYDNILDMRTDFEEKDELTEDEFKKRYYDYFANTCHK